MRDKTEFESEMIGLSLAKHGLDSNITEEIKVATQ